MAVKEPPIDQRDVDVMQSYHRCEASKGFFDAFYKQFMSMSPAIANRFAHTDMEKQRQVVMASLLMCLRLRSGDPEARRAVEQIGESHSRRGKDIPPHLYGLWLDALCEAVRLHDPLYSPLLKMKWRNAMQDAIALITSKYDSDEPA